MARDCIHLILISGKAVRPTAGTPMRCKASDAAFLTMNNLVTTNAGIGVFATSGGAKPGEHDDEATVIFKAPVPPSPPFEEP